MGDLPEDVVWQGKSKMAHVANIPIKAMNLSSRRLLGTELDAECNSFSKCTGILQDWRGLAEQMGESVDEIQALTGKEENTFHIIEHWSHTPNATIGCLFHFLEQMERYDILENDILQCRILDDVEVYKQKKEEMKMIFGITPTARQVWKVDSEFENSTLFVSPQGSPMIPQHEIDEFAEITFDDNAKTGKKQYYDAFVCYAHEDIPFVKVIQQMLEGHLGLKLCIPDRDMRLGSAKYTVISHLIKERCTKMIVVLSPSYCRSEECDFMTKFGHSLSPGAMERKLIPVMVKRPCPVPNILRCIVLVDYTKCDLSKYFWEKLARSVCENN